MTFYDHDEVTAWLERVHGDAPGLLSVGYIPNDNSGRYFAATVDTRDQAADLIRRWEQSQPKGTYLRITTLAARPEGGKRGGGELSHALPGLWADIDLDTIGHKHDPSAHDPATPLGNPLPPDETAGRLIVAESGLPAPTLWVHSGGGLYPLWLLDEPAILTDDTRRGAAQLSELWQDALQRSAQRVGYYYATGVRDLARVLRVPGTVNRKAGAERPCRLLEDTGVTYTFRELAVAVANVQPAASSPAPSRAPARPPSHATLGLTGPSAFDLMDQHVDFDDILLGAGWTRHNAGHSPVIDRCWTRPGGPEHLCSAHTLTVNPHSLVVLSDAAGLPEGGGQRNTRSRVFARLYHGGDETAAANDIFAAINGRPCTAAAAALPLPKQEALPPRDLAGLVPPPPTEDRPRRDDAPQPEEPTDREPPAGPEPSQGGSGKPSAATQLVDLAEDRYTFGISVQGEPFALPKDGPQIVRMLRGTDNSLRAELANAFRDQHAKVPPQQALADALLVLEGKANTTTPEELHLRVARTDEGDVGWVDLGDHTGSAVRITADGWEVVPAAPVLFRRTALTAPLPTPVRGGDLDELWALLNVNPEDRALLAGVLVASTEPDIPHPVIDLDGEQGTGKTTAGKTIVSVLDPSTVPARKAPKDVEQWTTAAAGSWWVGLDNLSGMPDWLSDALCRASTGDGDVRRKLYSDAGLHVVAFRRCVLINGIDLGVIRDDLADRLVTIKLDRIPEDRRRYDAELARAWTEAHPRILGALLDLTVRVQAALPDVELPNPPRMADFARILAAVDQVLHTQGLPRYRALADELAAEAVTGDPVLAALAEAITGPWTGTSAQLLDTIEVITDRSPRPPKTWPKDARALTGVLRRRSVSLHRLGWTIDDLGRGGKDGKLRWHIAPPPATDQAGMEAGIEAGITSLPAAMPAAADQQNPPLTCEEADPAGMAGMAGINPPTSLCLSLEMEGERAPQRHTRAPQRDGAETMPAMPAMPAVCPHGVDDGALPDPFVNGLARCPQCRQAQPREAS